MIIRGTNINNIREIDREYTNNLIYAYLKIHNILKDKERNKKQGKGLKIITPKQMLSRYQYFYLKYTRETTLQNLKTK